MMCSQSPVRRPHGIIFDLDGTLVHSAPAITASVNVALQAMGRPSTDETAVARLLGIPLGDKIHELLGDIDGEQTAGFIRVYRDHYRRTCAAATPFLPGVERALRLLSSESISMGIVSTKAREFIEPILEHLQCIDLFDVVIGSEDVGHLKPHPEPIRKALQSMELGPADCVYVGDTPTDIEAAHNADLKCISVYSGAYSRDELDATGADWLLESVRDIPQWLSKATC